MVSEAEKKWQWVLRIFCKYLFDYGFTKQHKNLPFETSGGIINSNYRRDKKMKKQESFTVENGKRQSLILWTIPTTFKNRMR